MTDRNFNEPNVTWNHHIQMAANQHWPTACLYIVATPIGNLADFSLRAYEALRRCNVIAAEDTRVTKNLLNSWGINTALLPAHRHNEHEVAETIIKQIKEGNTVALVSDAGAPAVSDPGAYIVQKVLAVGIKVVPIPGPSAVITALMASGATNDDNPCFTFAGFVPAKAKARSDWLLNWLSYKHPVIMFETPHRLLQSCQAIAKLADGDRLITVARELSKRFEEIATMPVADLKSWLTTDSKRQQGEFVLIVHADRLKQAQNIDLDEQQIKTMEILLAELSVRDAVRIGVKLTGIKRDILYNWALAQDKH